MRVYFIHANRLNSSKNDLLVEAAAENSASREPALLTVMYKKIYMEQKE